jgi:hypothetical protein
MHPTPANGFVPHLVTRLHRPAKTVLKIVDRRPLACGLLSSQTDEAGVIRATGAHAAGQVMLI